MRQVGPAVSRPTDTVTVRRSPRGLDRVEHQVRDHPVQQVGVAIENGPGARTSRTGVRRAVGMRLDQPSDGDRHRAQVERHELGGAHAREVEELVEQATQPIALAQIRPARNRSSSVGVLGARELFHGAADGRERIPDLVGQRGAQRRDRLQPLGAQMELLQFLQIGDV